MGQPLKKLDPNRTKDVFPETRFHGDCVLAFDERHKDFVEVAPAKVREMPRIYRFWLECRRRANVGVKTERRVKNVKSKSQFKRC